MIQSTLKTCNELLLEFNNGKFCDNSSKIDFDLNINDSRDVYNITSPFNWNNETLIAGRVEHRESEDSEIVFFIRKNGIWKPKQGYSNLRLQDPFVTKIGEEMVIGGVEIYNDDNQPEKLSYRTIFLKGVSLENLKIFAKGPEKMKDIRLLELEKNKILVFTRPQGKIGGRGCIAYTIINSLSELTIDKMQNAKVLNNQFIEEEWGGANQLHILKNGLIGVLSHIAKFDKEGNRHYYSSCFAFNVETKEYTPMKIIAIRDNFAKGSFKRKDLVDVIFSGGIIRKNDGKAELYCGVSDTEAHTITIDDPFLEYENI